MILGWLSLWRDQPVNHLDIIRKVGAYTMTVHSLCTGLTILRRENVRDFSLAAFLSCLLLGCSSTNEVVNISGSLTDAHDGKPIAGQEVVLYKFEESYIFFTMGSFVELATTRTNKNGYFDFDTEATEPLFIRTTACGFFGGMEVEVPRGRASENLLTIYYDEKKCLNKPATWKSE